MELKEKIDEIRAGALREIEDYARAGDSQGIAEKIKVVEVAELLAKRWDELSQAVENLQKGIAFTGFDTTEKGGQQIKAVAFHSSVEHGLSPRARGEARRRELLTHCSTLGIKLAHKGGTNYRTQDNKLVGIAYASERRPNRWFLGLPDDDYDIVILVCDLDINESSQALHFVIPKSEYDQYRNSFSKSGDQMKFNIVHRRGNYYLMIPNEDPISLARYLNTFGALAP